MLLFPAGCQGPALPNAGGRIRPVELLAKGYVMTSDNALSKGAAPSVVGRKRREATTGSTSGVSCRRTRLLLQIPNRRARMRHVRTIKRRAGWYVRGGKCSKRSPTCTFWGQQNDNLLGKDDRYVTVPGSYRCYRAEKPEASSHLPTLCRKKSTD